MYLNHWVRRLIELRYVCAASLEYNRKNLVRLGVEAFIDDAVGAHNEYRLIHAVAPLVNDKKLNEGALKHAKELAKKSTDEVSMSKQLGESIYTSCDGVVTGRSVTDAW